MGTTMRKRRTGKRIVPITDLDANDRLHGEFRVQLDSDGGMTIKHNETGLRLSVIARGDQPKIIYVEAYSYWGGDEVLVHSDLMGRHKTIGYTVHEAADPNA